MKNLTEFVNTHLLRAVFEKANLIFPEFGFVRSENGYVSTTTRKIDRTNGEKTGKVYLYSNTFWQLVDYRIGAKNTIDYLKERENKDDVQIKEYLYKITGVSLPEEICSDLPDYDIHNDISMLYSDTSEFMQKQLMQDTTETVLKTRKYLENRGYSSEEIQRMGIGFLPDQKQLFYYLEEKGYSTDFIKKNLNLIHSVGVTHQLAIPCESLGTIYGFKFRSVGGHDPKYLNSTGMKRGETLFNLQRINNGNTNITVVEGEFDALHATVKNIPNVVATGGGHLTMKQVESAFRAGAKSFTICFDYDGEEKKTDTHKRNVAAIKIIRSVDPSIKIYVVALPSPDGRKVDPDSFIREHGADAFQNLIDNAVADWEYRLRNLFDDKIETPKEQDQLIVSALKISSSLQDPIDQDRFSNQFISAAHAFGLDFGIKSLDEKLDLLAQARLKEEKDKKLKAMIDEASILYSKGETDSALRYIKEKTTEISTELDVNSYSELLVPLTEETLMSELNCRPESLDTGYCIHSDPLLLPPGALTFVVGPTNHGKTTMMLNLQLKISVKYPGISTIFISLEENRVAIVIKSLNIFLGKKLSNNNKASLYSFFKGKNEFISSDLLRDFNTKKESYFNELLTPERIIIQYTDSDIEKILEIIRYMISNAELPVGIIFIDYMQLLTLSQGKYRFSSRQEELKKICLILKDFSVETQLPIILGAQFNREVTNLLALDQTRIGEAGDIERIANLILGIWNNNFEGIASPPEKKEINRIVGGLKDSIYVKVLKNRDGRVGQSGLLHFEGNTGRISNINDSTGPETEL